MSDQSIRLSEYIEAKTFRGALDGYVFKNGDKGVGYYVDRRKALYTSRMKEYQPVSSS